MKSKSLFQGKIRRFLDFDSFLNRIWESGNNFKEEMSKSSQILERFKNSDRKIQKMIDDFMQGIVIKKLKFEIRPLTIENGNVDNFLNDVWGCISAEQDRLFGELIRLRKALG